MAWNNQPGLDQIDSEVRKKIYAVVERQPGIHLRRLQRRMGIPLSTLEYHLHRLERDGAIRRHDKKNRRGLYPSGKGFSDWDRDLLFHLRQGHRGDLLCLVHANPGIRFQELCAEMELAPSTVSYHARDLVADQILSELKKGREKAYEPVAAERFLELVRRYGEDVQNDVAREVLRTLLDESPPRPAPGPWREFRATLSTGAI